MCTVTFVPSRSHIFFTSSRDEHAGRPAAFLPQRHLFNGQYLLFPRDPQGGGSWIAAHENGNVAVLLNGALQPHQPKPPYRKSRGLIMLDLISVSSPVAEFEEFDFKGIEPFTVILFASRKLWSCIWDGNHKSWKALDVHKPHIWSSVTLYDPHVVKKREDWFKNWFSENPDPNVAAIVGFHKQGGEGDPDNDILMNRDNRIFTNSISALQISSHTIAFHYQDLRNGQSADCSISIQKAIPQKA
jgi:hypothetical protein